MNLGKVIESIFKDNATSIKIKTTRWVNDLQNAQVCLNAVKKRFHQWGALRAYVSVTKTRSHSRHVFSLRFFGQEVANLVVKGDSVSLVLKGHKDKNLRWFSSGSSGIRLKDGSYSWDGAEAKKFRQLFTNLAASTNGTPDVKSPEHRVESKFIMEMCKGSKKFALNKLMMRPVLIAGKFPLQVPVTISANTGVPRHGTGYIDILALHRVSAGKTVLSVWELKKPKAYAHAASQAYIYAFTLIKLLRSEGGAKWHHLFRPGKILPKNIEIEAVVAITPDQIRKFEKEKRKIQESGTSFQIQGDKITLHYACYEELPDRIKITATDLPNVKR